MRGDSLRLILVGIDADARTALESAAGEALEISFEAVTDETGFRHVLENGVVDMVITGDRMGWIDGLGVLRAVKASRPGCPVVLYFEPENAELAVEALRAGLDDCVLRTPRSSQALPGALRQTLDRARQRKADALRAGENRILERIASGAPLAEVLVSLTQLVEAQYRGLLCSILLLDADGIHMRHGAAPSLPRDYVRAVDGLAIGPKAGSCGTAMYLRQPVVVSDISRDPLWEDYRELAAAYGLRACWSTPILSNRGTVLGSFAMYYREVRLPSLDEQRLLEVARHIAGIAIERWVVEVERQETERRFRSVFEAAEVGIAIADLQGSELMINRAYHTMVGCRPGELDTVTAFHALTHPEDREADAALYRELVAGRRDHVQQEKRYLLRDGGVVWASLRLSLLRDGNGQPAYVLGMAVDITERKRAEEALRHSEEEYRRFFEADLAGNYVSTPDGELLACNAAFARMFGFESVAEAMQSRLPTTSQSAAARQAFLDRLRAEGHLEGYEHELQRKDGTPLFVVENASAVRDERGEPAQIHGHLVDETARRKAEEALRQAQKIDAIGRLAGGVAHDFNNLLGVIMGYCDLLEKQVGPQHPGRPRVEAIRKASERAAGLTQQLLAFSRKQVLQPKVLDLNSVVSEVSLMLRRLIGEDVELVTTLQTRLGRVRADPGQMEQVIINLVVNARDAMPHGGRLALATSSVELDEAFVRGHAGARAGPHVVLAVSDTGEGMDAETVSHVFEPFFTTKERGKGTGLGLATVYGIVKQSAGYITVDSEPGCGARFKIYLPRVDDELPARAPEASIASAAVPAGSGTVVLVEDETSLRAVAREMLEAAGYTVLECTAADEAVALVSSYTEPIHLLLTDVVMPGMSGREVAERIHALRPEIRTLYMSGYPDDAFSRKVGPDAAAHFIQKPFTARALVQRVRDVLD
jgi:PAS domain S-box-containing protein